MKKLNTFLIGALVSSCFFSKGVFAANIGTVLCESGATTAEVTVNIGGITWGDWWDYNVVYVLGFTAEGPIISFDSQRLNPSKSNYFFSYRGEHEIIRVQAYETTSMQEVEVSCM